MSSLGGSAVALYPKPDEAHELLYNAVCAVAPTAANTVKQ